jgi:hypothetical protein
MLALAAVDEKEGRRSIKNKRSNISRCMELAKAPGLHGLMIQFHPIPFLDGRLRSALCSVVSWFRAALLFSAALCAPLQFKVLLSYALSPFPLPLPDLVGYGLCWCFKGQTVVI